MHFFPLSLTLVTIKSADINIYICMTSLTFFNSKGKCLMKRGKKNKETQQPRAQSSTLRY